MNNKYYNNRKLLLNCVWVVTGIVLVVLSFPLSETQPLTPGPAAAEAEE